MYINIIYTNNDKYSFLEYNQWLPFHVKGYDCSGGNWSKESRSVAQIFSKMENYKSTASIHRFFLKKNLLEIGNFKILRHKFKNIFTYLMCYLYKCSPISFVF